jgi:ribosomal protein S6--L-glutamate ligase
MKRIGVIGTPGGGSSELLADTVAEITGGPRLLVDMSRVRLDLPGGSAWFDGTDLATLDGLLVKKIGARYSPDLLDRLEVLRFLAARGLPVFSDPMAIMRVLDRLSCTVTLQLQGIPMPPTTITETWSRPWKRWRLTARPCSSRCTPPGPWHGHHLPRAAAREAVAAYAAENPIMYIRKPGAGRQGPAWSFLAAST